MLLRNKKVLMLLSLLIAIGLWMYVMGNVDPETDDRITGIEIEMQGTDVLEENELTATLEKPKVVSVVLEGKRSQIKKAKTKGIKAYIDVSTCDYGENETEIYIKLPEGVTGVTVENISQETAVFTVK